MFDLRSKDSLVSSDPVVFPTRWKDPASSISQAFPDFHNRMRTAGRWMLGVDVCALILSFVYGAIFAYVCHVMTGDDSFQDLLSVMTLRQFIAFWATGLTAILWLDSRGHYRQRLPYWESVGNIVMVAWVGFLVTGFLEFASHNNSSRLWIAFSWIFFVGFVMLGRNALRGRLQRYGLWHIPAVIIGNGATADSATRALSRDPCMGFMITERLPSTVLSDMKKTTAWKQVLMLHDAQYVFLALEGGEIERYHAALRSLPRARVPFAIVPPWQGLPSGALTPHHFVMHDVMMLHDTNRLKLPLPRLTKRLVDIVLASLALITLLPLLGIITALITLDGGKAFFKQTRVGRNGQLFQCYKFRSMHADAEETLRHFLTENPAANDEWVTYQKLKNDIRVTPFGKFLRRTSLDELPQLINVLKGDMSLVGPRPCLPGQENLYAEDFSFYESVRPGITGPWQVSGRNQLTFKERVALEAWYARNWSLWLDIVILLKTIPTILKKEQAF